MKRVFPIVLFLLSLSPLLAAEAWFLEMDTRFHEALMKRFSEGDPVACGQVTDKLSELVNAGKIKELESISTDSETGGKVHPTAKFMRKLKGGEEAAMDVGTTYSGGSEATDERRFLIKSAGEGLGATLDIKVTGRLGKAWQPVFSIASGGSCRVLLERDPDSEEAFWKSRGLLTLSAPLPEVTTFTWVLGEGHPILMAGTEDAGDFPNLAEFHENVTRVSKASDDDWRNFGTDITWTVAAGKSPGFVLNVAAEEKGASTAARAFSAQGNLGNTTGPATSPITTFVEKIDNNGEHSNDN